MTCKSPLIYLPCSKTGKGLTAQAVDPKSTRIQLMNGHGSHFPDVEADKHYYVRVVGCDSCCETMRVVGKEQDELIVQRGFGTQCNCIRSNALVQYTTDTQYFFEDLLRTLPLNVEEPLKFSCETNTLSVDCSKLFDIGCACGCDGDDTDGVPAVGGGGGGGGLRGEPGPRGEQGVGIDTMTISATGKLMVTLTDGRIITAGTVPSTKGPPGERGPQGDKGDKGDPGTPAAKLARIVVDGSNRITFWDTANQQFDGGVITVPAGPKGDKGDPGVKGEDGYTRATIVKSGRKYYLHSVPTKALAVTADTENFAVTTSATGLAEFEFVQPHADGSLIRVWDGQKLIGIGVV